MIIDRIIIRNIGPFDKIDLKLSGKSVAFVGENGSGKTLMLSSIVDFIHEHLRGIGFQDVMEVEGNIYNYFRITTRDFLKGGSERGLIWISGAINGKDIYYLEEYGYTNAIELSKELQIPESQIPWPKANISKAIKTLSREEEKIDAQNRIRNMPILFLPATRFENESWKTEKYFNNDLTAHTPTNNSLGHPIELYSSFKDNYAWLTNMVINYLLPKGNGGILAEKLTLINTVLSDLIGREQAHIGFSEDPSNRLSIADKNGNTIISSLKQLSLGQMSILNVLINILRTSPIKVPIASINGLIVIDEIDAHLTGIYKTDVIPKIISYFPNIQFILTTHDPLLAIGIENHHNAEIIELPSGNKIMARDFSEFEEIRKNFRKQNSNTQRIVSEVLKNKKPSLIVEDEYTEIYKVAWLKLNQISFNHDNLENIFSKFSPFNIVRAKGYQNLRAFLNSNVALEMLQDTKIVGLFDFDDAYNAFNSLDTTWGKSLGEEKTGLYKHNNTMPNHYALMLPIPHERRNIASRQFGGNSCLSIELLFTNKRLGDHCAINLNKPGNIKCFSGQKSLFWQECCNYDKKDFKNFKLLFDKIYAFLDVK